MDVLLTPFGAEHIEALEPWFDDRETQRRLGGRPWIRRALSLLDLPTGEGFRGRITTGRHMWIALDESAVPVGFVDGETYDRYAAWDGTDPDRPVISDVVEVPSMGLAFVIDPARRRSGYGVTTLEAIMDHAAVSHVELFFAEIDLDNVASQRCVERAGFARRSEVANFEGMYSYSRTRTPAR